MFDTKNAACTNLDPEWFFPINNMHPAIERILERTCLSCPIFDDCLDYALKVNVKGYWAGTSERLRVRMRTLLEITPVKMEQDYKDLRNIPSPSAIEKRRSRNKLKETG